MKDLFRKFRAWKYSKLTMWASGAAVVIAVAVIVTVVLLKKKHKKKNVGVRRAS